MPDTYAITGILRENAAAGLYQGVRHRDGAPVVIKVLRANSPVPRVVEHLWHEHEILCRLEGSWVLKPYGLEEQQGQLRLVLEGFDAELLSALFDRPLEIGQFLDVAVRLTAAVADLHRQGVVHGDLKPENVLFQPRTGELKLLGFGIASRPSQLSAASSGALLVEGSPAYMSPEQTGHMNRGVDQRSDLYSLGVIFYELLTGELPFQAEDPLGWAHCHLAKQPRSPAAIVPLLPAGLAAIVVKLLAKQVEERYQSAHGLMSDLEHCRQEWTAQGDIATFPLGARDICDQFRISPRLYGREREAAALADSFERVRTTGRKELVLVSGYSGVGKTSLVQELWRPVAAAGGYFTVGKYEQYQRDIPYATLVQAFRELLQQILTESNERIRAWKAALQEALGVNGRLIVDLIPELELVLGPQPPVPKLLPGEAENRFRLVFERFIGVFARREHPLVLFLDDLQWLDPATLRLMAWLQAGHGDQALLLIGAYRDNEVNPSHPLTGILNEIRRSEVRRQELVLGPLSPPHLTQLVVDTLRRSAGDVAPLVQLVHDKTAGNPFFAIHFLTTLYREGQVIYHGDDVRWHWDLDAIRRQGFTDNVVELMLGRLRRMQATTQRALMLAACVGSTVEAGTLALLNDLTEDQLHGLLQAAMDEGLLWRVDGGYTFLHDRVQEAAYALLAPEQRAGQHLQIGRALLAHLSRDRLAENVFDIVGQLNRGASLITAATEKEHLAELNLIAGKRAKAAAAFASALNYLTAGTALLGPGAWDRSYELAFALHVERAEGEYLIGNYAGSEELLALALDRARSLLDRVWVFRLRQRLYQLSGRWPDAMTAALKGLELLGVTFPEDDEEIRAATEAEIELIQVNLRGRTIADLANVPLSDDAEVRALIGLLAEATPQSYNTRWLLWPLIVAKSVNLCLQRGHGEESPFIYCSYCMMLAGLYHNIPSAFEFSKMSLTLNERLPGANALRGRLLFFHASVVSIWCQHFRMVLPLLDEAFSACLASGDLLWASYLTYHAIWLHLENGDPLEQVADIAQRYAAFNQQNHNDTVHNVNRAQQQFVLSLQGRTRSSWDFSDDAFDEAGCVAALEQAGFGLGIAYYRIMKQIAAFHAGRFDVALDWADRATPMLLHVSSMANEATHYFYRALTLTALYPQVPSQRQPGLRQELTDYLEKLRFWADHCPENFANRYALLRAELARVEGRYLEAMSLYDRAIDSAAENGFVHCHALAAELAAGFYRSRGFDRIARTYLREARDCYARWGAAGKVRQLEQQHPQLVETPSLAPTAILSARAEQLDLLSVVKASEAISGETVLPQLQETLMRLALEHAGAQRGYLLLVDGERLTVHARAEIEGDQTRVEILPGLATSSDTLPMTLLNYVKRSGEIVVLADAATDTRYVTDEYFAGHTPRSVIGLPITRQGRLTGILYLENNLITGAFIPSRLVVVELLAAETAVSLETARLYADLQEENVEHRRAEQQARELNQQLAFRALHDDLTGLPNRALLQDHLRTALARAQRSERVVGLLFIDLDDFKSVNDAFGHVAADGFLVEISKRISGSLRETDTAARIGGDEFVVLCEDLADPADAVVVAQRIRSALSTDILISDRRIGASASIGISYSSANSTPEDLLRAADAAMYEAKRQGGHRWESADSSAVPTQSRSQARSGEEATPLGSDAPGI